MSHPDGRPERRRAAAIALAGLLLVGAGAGRLGAAEVPPPPEAPAPAPDSAGATDLDLYRLPDNYRGPAGGINQAAIVAQQKARLETINHRLSVRLRMTETLHYLFLSDADAALTARFVKWGEALFESLREQFGIGPRERVWDGKCVVLLFTRRAKFEEYSRVFDRHDAQAAGAYFAVESHGDAEPHLVHMGFPLDQRGERRLQELFAHEGTHAFFELYRTPGRLPLWLHEGLAEYMTTVNDPGLRPQKWPPAAAVAASRKPIRRVFTVETGENLTLDQYAVVLTLVSFLVDEGRPKFKQFIDGLKDGRPQEEALKAAYGFGLADLEAKWRAYATRTDPR